MESFKTCAVCGYDNLSDGGHPFLFLSRIKNKNKYAAHISRL